jgi:hypothetical protein
MPLNTSILEEEAIKCIYTAEGDKNEQATMQTPFCNAITVRIVSIFSKALRTNRLPSYTQ